MTDKQWKKVKHELRKVRDQIESFVEKYKETLVLCDGEELGVLKGLYDGTDEDGDLYYEIYFPEKGLVHCTCVGWIRPLKGKMSEEEYRSLEESYNKLVQLLLGERNV